MTKAQREARRQRNQELAQMDAANRCSYCKIALERRCVALLEDRLVFCSDSCMDAWIDVQRAMNTSTNTL